MDPKNAEQIPQQRAEMHPFSCEGLVRANSVYFDLKSIQSLTCGDQGFFRENRTQHS